MKLKIQENQNQGNSKPKSQVFMAICESQNPGSPKSRRFKIVKVDFLANLLSGKLIIWEAQNPGSVKSRKLKIRETQNLGNPKSGKPKIWETQNSGNPKSWKLKIRETQKLGTQNPGTQNPGIPSPGMGNPVISKSGKPKIQEALIWSLDGLKKGEEETIILLLM